MSVAPDGAAQPERNGRTASLQTAGEIVALLAGLVAVVYVIGGLVLTVRLLSDGFSGDAVVALLGQAPREFVVSIGLVQGIAPAALFGAGAALVYGLQRGPKPRFGVEDDRLDHPPRQYRTIAGLVGFSALLMVPAALLSWVTDDFTQREVSVVLVGFPFSLAFVLTGWFIKRRLARRTHWYRFSRAVAGGALFAGMALIPSILAVGVVPFQQAQVCLEGTDSALGATTDVEVGLVAQTKDRTILAVERSTTRGNAESILSVPTSKVDRLQAGDFGGTNLRCTGPL